MGGLRNSYLQELGCMILIMILLAILAYFMRRQIHFTLALHWVARFLLNFHLGLGSVIFLIHVGVDSLPLLFFNTLAVCIVVGCSSLFLLPYMCCEIRPGCAGFNIFYLMVLSFAPWMYAKDILYFCPFPLLSRHCPVLLGLLGFAAEAAKPLCCERLAKMLPAR